MPQSTRTIKIFCSPEEQRELSAEHTLLEPYDGFGLFQVSKRQLQTLSRVHAVEDITDNFDIRIGGRRIRAAPMPAASARATQAQVKAPSRGKHHYLVQFVGPIKQPWLAALRRLGGEPREPIADFTYVVRADEPALSKIMAQPAVRWVRHLAHRDRIDVTPPRRSLPRTRVLPNVFRVEFFGSDDLRRATGPVRKAGAEIVTRNVAAGVMTVKLSDDERRQRRSIERLSAVHGVRSVRRLSIKRPSNDVATTLMTTARALAPALNLSGLGEIVAVCDTGFDTGRVDDIHPDFRGRILAIKSYPIGPDFSASINNPAGDDGSADLDSGHGTHVAGSVLGSGAASEDIEEQAAPIRGLAYRAKLVFQAVEQEVRWKNPADETRYGRYLLAGIPNDLTQLFAFAYQKGARIHSNSWGGGDPGQYDDQCRQLDSFVWSHRDFCVLVAAGNDGTDHDGDGRINNGSVTSPGTAKNCITVGASESLRPEFNGEQYGDWWPDDYPVSPYRFAPMANVPSQVVPFSSRGPTRDGRIKPDVIAPGTFILSARSRVISGSNHGWAAFPGSHDYFYMGGTSMATPLAAGSAALLREFLSRHVRIAKPSAAMIKACLLGGASKVPGGSPATVVCDNQQGYGLVNIDAIVAPSGGRTAWFIDEDIGLRTGEVHEQVLDVSSSDQSLRIAMVYTDYPGPSLVNNLNLILRSPTGQRWVGNGHGALTLDARNNTEVIEVSSPAKGRWILQVIGSNVPQGPQTYAAFVSGSVRVSVTP